MSIEEKLITVAENQQKIYDKGKTDERNVFWENFQQGGNRKSYNNAFQYWRDICYNPIYPFIGITNAANMFNSCNIVDTKVPVDLTAIQSSNNMNGVFAYSTALVTINKLIVTENTVYTNWFPYCSKLSNITFEGTIGKSIDLSASKVLTKASIENIVSCLSETATGQTLTLSKTAVNNAFKTSTGAADGSTSAEWIALITPKSNSYNGLWTISLV